MGYNNKILGWMPEYELNILEKMVKVVPINGNIIEIGSLFGRSGICMAMSVDKSITIFCVDKFYNDMIAIHNNIDDSFPISGKLYDVEKIFLENAKNFSNIIMIKGDANEIDYKFPSIDMLFLDAVHKNPDDWNILCRFVPLVKVGGVISGHDYSEDYPDVKKNVHNLEKFFDITVIIHNDSSLWSINVTKQITSLELNKIK